MMNSQELLENAKGLKLLFAEDHDELREATAEILKTFFQQVDSVSNGEEAIELYTKNGSDYYDIVLTDIKMPKLSGVLLTEAIYAINPEQTIIVLSAHDESSYLLPLINLGIERFVKKPIDYQELMEVLTNAAKKINLINNTSECKNSSFVHLSNTCKYDKVKKLFYENEKTIYLTKYEIIFFTLLTENIGKIYSNEDIVAYYQSLNENIDPQNIRKLVSKLRKKIPANLIESIYGVGYRLVPSH
ncbi:response regulator transcription factor [Sulfurimonas autotrophica]|uniref:Two component transcriptional regulator, winged helix family n=1 Tax=Sulfurimonas autotrophica (strain ATCC BAA-671 / DSM 16294 / JCM 11897 / OK10) TaxID=563040 RepID=E0UUB8_SULAO|nr:response regulator transcription factor [Sulfurimonas autotrophica]ADN09493.1 two component transcriptional regulator, winged helix family [Sulfurimonas autotrophica DSM 16294]